MSNTETIQKPMILGIGGSGAAMVEHLAKIPGIAEFQLVLIDTDKTAVSKSSAPVKLSAASDWGVANGSGCGGDVLRGERSLARERPTIEEILKKASFLTVCGGLGGGTATGGIKTIASLARAHKIPAVFLLTTPFSFESYSRRHNAEDCIRELLPVTDILLTMPNDLLFATVPPNTPVEAAFARSAEEMAHTVFGVAELMRCKSLLGADYAAFMNPVCGKRCECSLGVGRADTSDGLDRTLIALDRMLASPFLGGKEYLKKVNSVFLILSGGTELQIAELKRALELATGVFPEHLEILSGAAVSSSMDGQIQLTAITVRYENAPPRPASDTRSKPAVTPAPEPSPAGSGDSGNLLQGELKLSSYSRGRFENMPVWKYANEDLDIPTFQRRNISIDRGKKGI